MNQDTVKKLQKQIFVLEYLTHCGESTFKDLFKANPRGYLMRSIMGTLLKENCIAINRVPIAGRNQAYEQRHYIRDRRQVENKCAEWRRKLERMKANG